MSVTPAKIEKIDANAIPRPKLDPVAGLLSYLIPGLGQVVQGRVAKGVVFFVSLYSLFFYGFYVLGNERNVYLPDTSESNSSVTRLLQDLYNRPHFAGQFFIGVAAWPAVWQYMHYDPRNEDDRIFGKFMRSPRIVPEPNGGGRDGPRAFLSEEINNLQRKESKVFDLAWVYTVIAGVLNILVIYDAVAGPAFREALVKESTGPKPEIQQTATA